MKSMVLTLGACYALLNASLYGLTIVNNSDSPKQIELVAYTPNNHPIGGFNALTVIKKELQPHESVESPLSLREAGISMKWGNEKYITPETKTSWKALEKDALVAKQWQPVGQTVCGKNKVMCDIVIPPTWRIEENAQGFSLFKDTNTPLKAKTLEELLKDIPYRRIVDTIKKILATSKTSTTLWKKFGSSNIPGEEIVIPHNWKRIFKENDIVITTDTGKEIIIPYTRKIVIDPYTKNPSVVIFANEKISLQAIPYRRKDSVVFEIVEDNATIIEESLQKPLKISQFSMFRRFSPRDALPTSYARGVPERVGQDHVFEITGSGYDADVTLAYSPAPTTETTLSKRKYDQLSENTVNNRMHSRWSRKAIGE